MKAFGQNYNKSFYISRTSIYFWSEYPLISRSEPCFLDHIKNFTAQFLSPFPCIYATYKCRPHRGCSPIHLSIFSDLFRSVSQPHLLNYFFAHEIFSHARGLGPPYETPHLTTPRPSSFHSILGIFSNQTYTYM